jgi:predicted dehydrogenase
VLGTGFISGTLAEAITQSESGSVVAVGSRSEDKAREFGERFGATRFYDSYEGVINDPEIDIVYNGLPNHLHAPLSILCARAGKHILCEKPVAMNHDEAVAVIETIKEHDVFFMEAFMYRTHPQMAEMVELIRDGAIGQVRLIESSFGFNRDMTGDCRMNPEWGGGGIMDVGCYVVSGSRLAAGAALGTDFAEPTSVNGIGFVDPETQVDLWASAALQFDGGIQASLACGMQVETEWRLCVFGSEGYIRINTPWLPHMDNHRFVVKRSGSESEEEIPCDKSKTVFLHEIETVAKHIADRQVPPPCMSWDDTLGNMKVLDEWRRQVGVRV